MEPVDSRPQTQAFILVPLVAAMAWLRWNSWEAAVFYATCTLVGILGWSAGWWKVLWELTADTRIGLWNALVALFTGATNRTVIMREYEVYLGEDVDTQTPVVVSLEQLGSFGVWATTGGGKTTAVHSIIHWLIKHHSPDELQLVISDLKDGLDFRIYRAIPHLMFPIADDTNESLAQINGLLEEKKRRGNLFKAIPADRVCNNMEDYHRLSAELELGLPPLSRIVAIFDEFQNVTMENEEALNGLIKLAKAGRAFGISIICATQFPKVEAVPSNLKSQFVSNLCGYLVSPSHYYKIAELDREWWVRMDRKIPGRFIATIAGERRMVQIHITPRKELEALARRLSDGRHEPTWTTSIVQRTAVSKQPWIGSTAQKRAVLLQWFELFDEIPTAEGFTSTFDASRRTYFEWVPRLWKEYEDGS